MRAGGPWRAAMARPVSVPPVNEIVGMSGWATIAVPASAPVPCTMLSTPGGNPASSHNSASRYAVIGVISEGLATAVLPVAIAGAIFHVNR